MYPFADGTGDYTLAVTYVADPLPSPIAKILPFTSEVTTHSSSTFRFSLTESTDITVLISELTADFDCRVEPETECSNNRGTLDDSWSGTLESATHSLTVYRTTVPAASSSSPSTEPVSRRQRRTPTRTTIRTTTRMAMTTRTRPAPRRFRAASPSRAHPDLDRADEKQRHHGLPVGVPSLRNHELEFPDGWFRDRIKPECHHTDVEHRHFGLGGSVLPGCSVQRGRRRPVVQRDQAGVRRPA